jgi:type IV secretion system protein VirB11
MNRSKWLLGVVVDVSSVHRDARGRFVSVFYEPRRQRLARWDDAVR